MERGDLAEFEKNATQMMIFLPIENVGQKIKRYCCTVVKTPQLSFIESQTC